MGKSGGFLLEFGDAREEGLVRYSDRPGDVFEVGGGFVAEALDLFVHSLHELVRALQLDGVLVRFDAKLADLGF